MHVPGQARRDRPDHRRLRTRAEMTLDHTKVPGSHHGVLPCPIDLNDGAEAFRDNQRQGLWPRRSPGRGMSAASIKPMKMMDRPMAVADVETIGRRDRRADPCLGVAHRGFEILALGEACCDGGR